MQRCCEKFSFRFMTMLERCREEDTPNAAPSERAKKIPNSPEVEKEKDANSEASLSLYTYL